ncbi:ketopantoate reductase family protein [Novosphingobium cyanobacteriorum]|uniref:2-dehydropantoate 2-reductase n=1 Tax=Novosphingobium cyanobacteriorum TaxID=3024215 RepID=A0ABT6CIQ4_9SPHN|nr:ketopantoate reductase family protein [Novosphingobium cyanobacteriorum]MDF8333801.1 ketopantoate reductase family protein [Novosphingobium cyanobacteriorum]
MKIVVIGAGAMGCLFAARLGTAGHDVTVVDVDRVRLSAIAADGIVLADDQGERTVAVGARAAADVAAPVDLVVLFTKGMHSAAAIRSVAHLAGGSASVLTLQNGLGNVEAIADVFAQAAIVWGVTDFPADLQGLNRVASHGAGHIWLGPVVPDQAVRAEAIAALLVDAGLDARAVPDVQAMVWDKAAFNSALNALCTLGNVPVGRLDCPPARHIAGLVIAEIAATAQAAGVDFDLSRVMAKVDFALANHTHHKPSMLQDRLAGRPTEIESINGAVLAVAARHGVNTPTLQLITDLVRIGEPAPAR